MIDSDAAIAYHPRDAPHFHDQYCKITTPLNISQPQFVNGKAALEPVPGMVKMVPGILYIYEVCGDPVKIVTMGCSHTLESLQAYPEHAVIHQLVDELQLLTWEDKGPAPSTRVVYQLPEFKCNDRSSKPQKGSYEGSYNLAEGLLSKLLVDNSITSQKSQRIIQKKRRLDYELSDSELISNEEPENDEEKSFEVEDIVDSMLVEDGSILYCIHWKGFGPEDDCYFAESKLQDCSDILTTYRENLTRECRSSFILLDHKSTELWALTYKINQSYLETTASSTQSANTRMQTTKSFGVASSQDAIKALSHNAHLNHQMAGIRLDIWKDKIAQMIIDHAHKAAASISALLKETEQHELLLRALLWEIGRLYLMIEEHEPPLHFPGPLDL
ncbi:hypothetical protein EDD22DRAFT_963285 [Suillus occidentalis]|nr:hypothetical protein EDD22DRAFT_963285 [Suillus occidentalis]